MQDIARPISCGEPGDGALNRNVAGNVVPSLGREAAVKAFYGDPGQMFVSLEVSF